MGMAGNFVSDGSNAAVRRLPERSSPPTTAAATAFLRKQRIPFEEDGHVTHILAAGLSTTVSSCFWRQYIIGNELEQQEQESLRKGLQVLVASVLATKVADCVTFIKEVI